MKDLHLVNSKWVSGDFQNFLEFLNQVLNNSSDKINLIYLVHTVLFSKITFLCLVINFSTHSPFFLACCSSFSSYLFLYIYYFFVLSYCLKGRLTHSWNLQWAVYGTCCRLPLSSFFASFLLFCFMSANHQWNQNMKKKKWKDSSRSNSNGFFISSIMGTIYGEM